MAISPAIAIASGVCRSDLHIIANRWPIYSVLDSCQRLERPQPDPSLHLYLSADVLSLRRALSVPIHCSIARQLGILHSRGEIPLFQSGRLAEQQHTRILSSTAISSSLTQWHWSSRFPSATTMTRRTAASTKETSTVLAGSRLPKCLSIHLKLGPSWLCSAPTQRASERHTVKTVSGQSCSLEVIVNKDVTLMSRCSWVAEQHSTRSGKVRLKVASSSWTCLCSVNSGELEETRNQIQNYFTRTIS